MSKGSTRRPPRYVQVYDGEWIQPVRRGYRVKCCDCSLVHVIDIRLVAYAGGKRRKVQFRAFRQPKRRKA